MLKIVKLYIYYNIMWDIAEASERIILKSVAAFIALCCFCVWLWTSIIATQTWTTDLALGLSMKAVWSWCGIGVSTRLSVCRTCYVFPWVWDTSFMLEIHLEARSHSSADIRRSAAPAERCRKPTAPQLQMNSKGPTVMGSLCGLEGWSLHVQPPPVSCTACQWANKFSPVPLQDVSEIPERWSASPLEM